MGFLCFGRCSSTQMNNYNDAHLSFRPPIKPIQPNERCSRRTSIEVRLISNVINNNNNNNIIINNNNNSDCFDNKSSDSIHNTRAEKEKEEGVKRGKCATKCCCTEGTASFSMNAFRKSGLRWLLPRSPQSFRRRLVYKSGECNISRVNIDKRGRRYLADIFTTVVDIKWRWNLFIFALAFTLSWVFFAFVWWLICYAHGDMAHYGEEDWKPCVADVYDFATALLFSIETQQTIGYGTRFTSSECPVAVVVMMIQSCFGIIIQALMTGLVFAKISRPKKRAQTLMFSKNALVCQRDNELCFLFRVGDMRKSNIVEAQVRAIMVSKRVTREGEVLALYQRDLHLGGGGEDETAEGRLFLVWPVILEHRITPDSPLWEISSDDLKRKHFEILVILEGIVESTGMTTQARTSYLPNEILWGHRFERLVTYQRANGQYLIDYASFNRTMAVEMSPLSAKDLASARNNNKRQQQQQHTNDDDDDRSECSDDLGAGDALASRSDAVSDELTVL